MQFKDKEFYIRACLKKSLRFKIKANVRAGLKNGNDSMRVVIVFPHRLDIDTGSSKTVLYGAQCITELGFDVTLLAESEPCNHKKFNYTFRKLEGLGEEKPILSVTFIKKCVKSVKSLMEEVLRGNHDVIEVHALHIVPHFAAVLAAKIKRAKVVVCFHDLLPEVLVEIRGFRINPLLFDFFRFCEAILCLLAEEVVVVSDAMANALLRSTESQKLNVLYHPITMNEIETIRKAPKGALRRRFKIPLNSIILTYVGGMQQRIRGLEPLIEAYGVALKNVQRSSRLVFVGGGPALSELFNRAEELNLEDKIIFTGQVPREEAYKYIADSDALIIPNPRNSFSGVLLPSKLLEYMAAGKIILTSRLPQIRTVLQNNAIYFDPDEPASMSKSIQMIIDNADELKSKGRHLQSLLPNFEWEKNKATLERMYRGTLFS
jgi:glycosyltransferase involved in cell wall biosynthesis